MPPQPRRIHLAHVRKPRRRSVRRWARPADCAQQVDVIVDDHQRALREAGVDAAGGIGQDHLLHAEPAHHARGKHDGRQIVPLVEVGAPGQRGDAPAPMLPDHERPAVADDGRRRPVRQIAVRHRRLASSSAIGEVAEPGAEDDGRLRQRAAARADVRGRLLRPASYGVSAPSSQQHRRRRRR